MKNIFVILLFIVFLTTACNNDKPDFVSEMLYKKLQESNDFIKERNNRKINLLIAAENENPIKVKKWLALALKEDSVVNDFIIYSDSIISANKNYNTDELLLKYSTYRDYLSNVYKDELVELQWGDYLFDNNFNTKYITIQMIHDMLKNESILLSYFYKCTDCAVEYFNIPIETKCLSSIDSSYSFSLNSIGLIKYDEKERYVEIDSIFYNGNITNLKSDIEYSDILFSINLDSLNTGNYKVFGKIILVRSYDGRKVEYPFEHKFKK